MRLFKKNSTNSLTVRPIKKAPSIGNFKMAKNYFSHEKNMKRKIREK
jgi:hypothetical protein